MSLDPVLPPRPLTWHPALVAIQAVLEGEQGVYIVGGAVRDAMLQRPLHDIDLASQGDGRPIARKIANAFGGAYYPLDPERGVGRAIIDWEGEPLTIDVAQFRGSDLLTDLQKRDFTLNAMAVDMAGDLSQIIDPTGGLRDLANKRLRQCSPDSVASDPVRALRAIRTSLTHGLLIEPSTREAIKDCAARLADVSPERVRDELFQILDSKRPSAALAVMQQMGLLATILPEAVAMVGVEQSAPHQFDVWRHTLSTLDYLGRLLQLVESESQRDQDLTANLQIGMSAIVITKYRDQLRAHLAHSWPNGRSHRALLVLAGLLHDCGKPAARTVEPGGRVRFFRHEQIGAELAYERALALRLSKEESERLTAIVRNHMRPHLLHNDHPMTRRGIYRFWRDTGPAGVDVCLLALADYLGTYGPTLEPHAWIAYLETIQTLLEHYYEHHETTVAPPPLITGQTLLDRFGLQPGPQIGSILEQVREAQAAGEITTHEEALDWVQRFLGQSS